MKRTAVILFFMLVLACAATAATVSVITMKDGKVYKGRILDLDDGVYTVEINGRRYSIKEEEVQKTGWETDGREPEKASEKRKKNDGAPSQQEYYFYLKPHSDYLLSNSTDYSAVFPAGFLCYGIDLGIDNGNSFIRTSYGINFLTGSASGTQAYHDILDDSEKSTRLSQVKYVLQGSINFSVKPVEKLPVGVFAEAGAGAVVNNDVLESYPVLDIYPSIGHYEKRAISYARIAAFGTAGLSYYATNNFVITAGIGYQLINSYIYKETDWIIDEYYGYYASPPEAAVSGLIFNIAIKLRV